jgi:hypothetical protein
VRMYGGTAGAAAVASRRRLDRPLASTRKAFVLRECEALTTPVNRGHLTRCLKTFAAAAYQFRQKLLQLGLAPRQLIQGCRQLRCRPH